MSKSTVHADRKHYADRLRAALQVPVDVAKAVDDDYAQVVAERAATDAGMIHIFSSEAPSLKLYCNELGRHIARLRDPSTSEADANHEIALFTTRYSALLETMQRMTPRQFELARAKYRRRLTDQ